MAIEIAIGVAIVAGLGLTGWFLSSKYDETRGESSTVEAEGESTDTDEAKPEEKESDQEDEKTWEEELQEFLEEPYQSIEDGKLYDTGSAEEIGVIYLSRESLRKYGVSPDISRWEYLYQTPSDNWFIVIEKIHFRGKEKEIIPVSEEKLRRLLEERDENMELYQELFNVEQA